MRTLATVSIVFGILGLLVAIATFPVRQSYAGRAEQIQLARPADAAGALFDETHTPIGSPQAMIIDDRAAFLEGSGENGARLANDDYLREKGIYPLQLQTVDFIAGLVRLGGLLAGGVGIGLGLWLRRRSPRSNQGALEAHASP